MNLTQQRIIIYKEFTKAKDHPSAEAIFLRVKKLLPTISFDTVYRTLNIFYDIGIADIVASYGTPKRFDPNINKHEHFMCVRCDLLFDLFDGTRIQTQVPKRLPEKFSVLRKRVFYEGLCNKCNR
ncbi:MAG: Fur family transcriptional regulator [Planctomycetota bacterium]